MPYSARPSYDADPPEPLILIVGAKTTDPAEVRELLAADGYIVEEAESAAHAVERARGGRFDLIVLDGAFGDGSALALCRKMAAQRLWPILMIAEDADVTDRVLALEMGADSVMGRPFHRRELLAQVRALLRRAFSARAPKVAEPVARLTAATRTLTGPAGERVVLQPAIFALLHRLVSGEGEIVTSEDAGAALGGAPAEGQLRTTVARLRREMVKVGFGRDCIRTVRSEGYLLDPVVRVQILGGERRPLSHRPRDGQFAASIP